MIYLVESGVWGDMPNDGHYVNKIAPLLRAAHKDFLLFKKVEKLDCSQPRFTPARLSRKMQNSYLSMGRTGIRNIVVIWLPQWLFCAAQPRFSGAAV